MRGIYRFCTICFFLPAVLFLLAACGSPAGEPPLVVVAGPLNMVTRPATNTPTPLPSSPIPRPINTPTATETAPPTNTSTPRPSSTPAPTLTAGPTDTPPPTHTPTATPTPVVIHDLSADHIVIMPPEVVAHAQMIYAAGQKKGRDPTRFSLAGDSTIYTHQFLAPFDTGAYNLGDYAYLQSTIDYFAGSFARPGVAVRRGFSANLVMDSMWADKEQCRPNEHALSCEIRLYNPAFLLIKLGTNDSSYLTLDENMRAVVRYTIAQGVVPVLGTKANRIEGDNSYNNVLRQIAADFAIPLWDFDLLADKLPGRGLDQDGVHLIAFQEADYTLSYALWSGYGPLNLTALMILDTLRQEVIFPGQ